MRKLQICLVTRVVQSAMHAMYKEKRFTYIHVCKHDIHVCM